MFLMAAEFNFYANRHHFVPGHHWQPLAKMPDREAKTANSNVAVSFHGQN
jgi:hypothetical protein